MELTITIRTIEEPDLRTMDSTDVRRQKLLRLDETNDAIAERIVEFAQSFDTTSEYMLPIEASGIVSYSIYSVVEKPVPDRLPKKAVSTSRVQQKSFGLGQAVVSHQFLLSTDSKAPNTRKEIIVLARDEDSFFQWCKVRGRDPSDPSFTLVLNSKMNAVDEKLTNGNSYLRQCELYGVFGWWENPAICNDWVAWLCQGIVAAGGIAKPYSQRSEHPQDVREFGDRP